MCSPKLCIEECLQAHCEDIECGGAIALTRRRLFCWSTLWRVVVVVPEVYARPVPSTWASDPIRHLGVSFQIVSKIWALRT